jgi:hypothetical protein
MWEVLVPHEPTRGVLVGVRRMLVLSSIAELQQVGLYERYCAQIDSGTLANIMEMIGPGWLPLELARAHYEACDRMQLNAAEIHELGDRAGNKMSSALLGAQGTVLSAPRSPWDLVSAYARMGRRISEGGSSQYVKVGPNKLLIEHVGNPLYAIDYYRSAHSSFMRGTFSKLGVSIGEIVYSPYRSENARIEARLSWK